MTQKRFPSLAHWGAFNAVVEDGRVVACEPFGRDPAPSHMLEAMPGMVHSPLRIARPAIREGWREGKARTGNDTFREVTWDEALDAVAQETARVRDKYGAGAILGGSYGWASAGRVHHARTLLRRFLFLGGGCVDQLSNYSFGAAQFFLPHVIGTFAPVSGQVTDWTSVVKHTRLMVAFGGLALKNAQITSGGAGAHVLEMWLKRAKDAGVEFVIVTPNRSDVPEFLGAQWLPIKPNTDTAMMLAMAHTLIADNRHDREFLARYCTGFEAFERYVVGGEDGTPKTPEWAEAICGVPAQTIRDLARRAADVRSMITCAWSLQRAHHGEQPYWAAITLAAMLGGIGLPGGGFGFGHGSTNGIGNPRADLPGPELAPPLNPARLGIPVARMADMLCAPGEEYEFNGHRLRYPDIKMIFWAGGNPFHHHQDLNRLQQAWQKPDTVVVNETWWNPTARRADIVLPATTTLERNDVGGSSRDAYLFAMHQAIKPIGQARNDFDIFGALAARLGYEQAFTEGRDEMGWCQWLYDRVRAGAATKGVTLPGFQQFWAEGFIEFPPPTQRVRAVRGVPCRSGKASAQDAVGQDRDRLRDYRQARLRRLPATPGLDSAGRMARQCAGQAFPAAPRHQSAGNAPAQPVGSRLVLGGRQGRGPRADPHQHRRRRAPQHPQRRRRAHLQRPRRVSRRRGGRRWRRAAGGGDGDGRLARPIRWRSGAPRQSQRADARHRHLAADSRLCRAHGAGRNRTLGGAAARSARVYAAEARQG